tara:strand:- start:303 stop:548 length:246 start_codon:yes stop_codon:yes gene_type:complete
MTEEEILEEISKSKKPEDYFNLYVKVFGEEPALNGNTWGEYPVEQIVEALIERKKIKKDRFKNVVYITIPLLYLSSFSQIL